jgi:stress response protein YsnF
MELLPSNVIRGVAQASATYQSQAITYHSNVQDSDSSTISTYSEQLRINSTGTYHTIQ